MCISEVLCPALVRYSYQKSARPATYHTNVIVQIAERKKLHQNLMKRLKKEPALATVSQPELKL